MSIPLIPNVVRDGDTLRVEDINENLREMKKELADGIAHRYSRSSFVLPFNGMSQATSQEGRQYIIKTPAVFGAFVIERVELYLAASAETFTFSLSGSTSGWTNMSLAGNGATTVLASTSKRMDVQCAAATELTFEVDSAAGTWAITNGYAVVHIRHDRHLGSPPATFNPTLYDAGNTDDGTTLNADTHNFDHDVADNGRNDTQLRIVVIRGPRGIVGTAITTTNVWGQTRIPDAGAYVHSLDLISVAPVGTDLTVHLRDDAGTSQGTGTATGNGSNGKRQGVEVDWTQDDNDPSDTSDADYLEYSGTGGGTVEHSYVVLYLG